MSNPTIPTLRTKCSARRQCLPRHKTRHGKRPTARWPGGANGVVFWARTVSVTLLDVTLQYSTRTHESLWMMTIRNPVACIVIRHSHARKEAQLEQYLLRHEAQAPVLASPALARALSTTAHARQTGHSGSLDSPIGMPCVAMSNVWSSIA